jgi:hypothetical protein
MAAIVTTPTDVIIIVGEKLYFSGPQSIYLLAKLVGFDANKEVLNIFIDLLKKWETDGGIHIRKSGKYDVVVMLSAKSRKNFKQRLKEKPLNHTYHSILAGYGLKEDN